jgi:integrase
MAINFTVTNVKTQPDGRHADKSEKGLYLLVRTNPNTGIPSRSWQMRYSFEGKAKIIAIGSVNDKSLKDARDDVAAKKQQIRNGIDPDPKVTKPMVAPAMASTFRQDAKAFFEHVQATWRSDSYRREWMQSLENHIFPHIGDRDTASLTTDDIVTAIKPIWATRKADLILDRIRLAIEYAIDTDDHDRFIKGNPATRVRKRLPQGMKPAEKAHGSLPWRDAPTVYASLVGLGDQPAAQALRMLLLCCTPRAAEIIGAKWSEIRDDEFHVPAERMKSKKARIIPLSKPAQALLAELRGTVANPDGYIFRSKLRGKLVGFVGKGKERTGGTFQTFAGHIDSDKMLVLFQKLVNNATDPVNGEPLDIHGLRATFSTWVADNRMKVSDMDAREIALDHVIGDQVTRAYDRADLLKERCDLAERWARHLTAV